MRLQKLQPAALIAAVVVLSTVLAACQPKVGGPGTFPTPNAENSTPSVPETASITISNFAYSPTSVKVRPGATIRVTNKDKVGHTVTSDDGTSFDTGILAQDATGEFTAPMTAGTYSYHCTPHPDMKSELIVE